MEIRCVRHCHQKGDRRGEANGWNVSVILREIWNVCEGNQRGCGRTCEET
jgi:hypothetical protein